MTLAVRLTFAAVQDLALAARWYSEEAPYMLASFEEEVAAAFGRISGGPDVYQIVEATIRRAPLRKFPFSIFYRTLPQWIEVIAVLHQSRDPRTWRRRV